LQGIFTEYKESLNVEPETAYTRTYPTQNARTITVFVKNTGGNTIRVHLQNSPDGTEFVDDPQILELAPGETGTLVPYLFSKFIRAVIEATEESSAFIWFQIQQFCYASWPA
jgi:hypothetical protein